MNNYWNLSLKFQKEIISFIEKILDMTGKNLILKIENLNLLSDSNNCIKSSTAIGFCMEEFVVSKLVDFTKEHNDIDNAKILRNASSTQNSSYDCYSNFANHLFFINIKLDKNSNNTNNNGVAAIQKLYNDYVELNPEIIKHYMILKLHYSLDVINNERKIIINSVESFFLEEIDFSLGHKQDNRNWSEIHNKNSGRIQITNKMLLDQRLSYDDISYEKTKLLLEKIYQDNKN